MLLLRLTSPNDVRGIQSDDDFEIGRFTRSGTYNLLIIGAIVGIIGVAAYQLVAPHLLGPPWFRRLTVGLASGAVVGSMLLHADGVDFTRLKPTWLAISSFIALPFVFGLLIEPAVTFVTKDNSPTRRRPWLVAGPLVCIACFPPTIFALVFATPIVGIGAVLASNPVAQRVRVSLGWSTAARAAWFGIAVLGLVAVVHDINAIA